MNPYQKALLSETNVTKGIVGPAYAELGYITFGGRGYDRNDTPQLMFKEYLEDYNSSRTPNASAMKVDGVGTISPVMQFLSPYQNSSLQVLNF